MVWLGRGVEGLGIGERILLVQAHGRALVHAHVGVAQQASGLALDALWIQSVQLLWGHFQVGLHLWTGGYLWDVETILPSCKDTRTIIRNNMTICYSRAIVPSYSQLILGNWNTT